MTTKRAPVSQNLYENGVYYPDSDGEPLPNREFQVPLFLNAVSPLRGHFASQPHTHVNGNTFMYYVQGDPSRSVSPDCYVAFDVDVDLIFTHNSYRVWAVGKPPDFALEIASENTAARDLTEKRALYAEIGIGEYWRYDSTPDSRFYRERLVGERLVDGQYQRIDLNVEPDGTVWGHCPTLGLDLCWDNGRLRYYDPSTGEWLLNYEEQSAAREAAEAEVRMLREQLRRLQEQQ